MLTTAMQGSTSAS